jgi:hypothetical protein
VEVHETRERLEHAEHAHHQDRKRAALLIIVLAVALAIIEMAGKEAQFASIAHNILSSDTYAFFQAKTVRTTVLRTASEAVSVLASGQGAASNQQAQQLREWQATIDRLDSDPQSGEGRKELLEHARVLEEERDQEERAYHHFEYAAAGMQLAIVVASAAVITEMALLELLSAAIGAAGLCLALLGWLAPSLLKL